MTTDASTSIAGPGRGARGMALLFAVFWGYLFFGIIDLLVFLQGPEFHASFHLETGWGLFFLVMAAVPLAAIAVAPRSVLPAAVQQVLLAAVAVAIGAALSASPKHLLPAVGLGATALVVAALSGSVRAVLPSPRRWWWGPGSLVIVAVVPWLGYALAAAENARAGRHVDLTWGLDHWPIQAALAVGIVLVAALVATFPPGSVLAAWCVGVCAAWFGVVSSIYPDLDGSLGRTWGVAAIAWGLAFVTVTHATAARRARSTTGPGEESESSKA